MKYLFVVLTILLTYQVSTYSPEPLPTCTTPKIQLNQFPISLHEVQSFPVDDLFTGFNLDFNLTDDAPDFVLLRDKTTKIKNFQKSQTGLKSYHLDHKGNEWGKTLMTLS